MLTGSLIAGAIGGTLGIIIIPKIDDKSSSSVRLLALLIAGGIGCGVVENTPKMAQLVGYDAINELDAVKDTVAGIGMLLAITLILKGLKMISVGISEGYSSLFQQPTDGNPSSNGNAPHP